MAEFKVNNGKKGVERVIRTATGYRMFVYNPGNPDTHILEEDGARMILGRGVEDNGKPFIEIEFNEISKEAGREILSTLLNEAFAQKGLTTKETESNHGDMHISFHVDSNCLSKVFKALLLVTLPNGQPLIPDAGRIFVSEQQKVRHGLEQSLLNAFGNDMYARPIPSSREKISNNIPKSEVNRIARLVSYFRNGVPEMHDLTGATA